jgi:cbb3-type cytochrome c oxidase subunit III
MKATATRNSIRTLFCVSVALLLSTACGFAKSVWDGVYTESQAQRGQMAYAQYCLACHKADLLGIEGALRGEPFMERRREDTLETWFLDMKATMPRRNPRSLPDQTYVDIIAYALQNNDMPAGALELTPDLLDKTDLIGKDGPKPVPNFAPVLSVGCLVESGQNRWTLTNASEPVRTRDSFRKIEKELTASLQRPQGDSSYRLADAENFEAPAHVGKKVQVKGVIVRAPAGNRINVNSIEPIADFCQ